MKKENKHICEYCSKKISKMHIKKHNLSCKLNPLNLKYCLNCGCILTSTESKKFCSRSCSASFNNKKRTLSEETKNKISHSIKEKNIKAWNKGKRKYNIKCEICGKLFHRQGKYCFRRVFARSGVGTLRIRESRCIRYM